LLWSTVVPEEVLTPKRAAVLFVFLEGHQA
jgi:hypothetical protein